MKHMYASQTPFPVPGTVRGRRRIHLGFIPKANLARWVQRFELGTVGMKMETGWGRI